MARHETLAQTIWTLFRMHKGERDIVGQYSTETNGMQEVQRIIAKECGLKQVTHLPAWTPKIEGKELLYRRERELWWFRLEPWPLDGESA